MDNTRITQKVHKRLPSCWRRRADGRVEDPAAKARRKPVRVVRLGFRRRWRPWNLRAARQVRWSLALKKAAERMREAYVNAMVSLAGALAARGWGRGKGGAVWRRRIPRGREERLDCWSGNFEGGFMLHLYDSVIATR
ncbi:hypothetical protein HPP92_002659 [Vanilla planifolia]|uniref:Uncharacterized protein n=1 Tax=Vanilla planifolia TaxID=51239 RepID=A0A835SE64_VANPL|nr:hypothetical protein HPP92_002659 [Vanilla planifolia]